MCGKSTSVWKIKFNMGMVSSLMLLQIKGSKPGRCPTLSTLKWDESQYAILSCSTVPLQRTAALPLESGYQPPICPLAFLCLGFVKTSWLSKVGLPLLPHPNPTNPSEFPRGTGRASSGFLNGALGVIINEIPCPAPPARDTPCNPTYKPLEQ